MSIAVKPSISRGSPVSRELIFGNNLIFLLKNHYKAEYKGLSTTEERFGRSSCVKLIILSLKFSNL